MTKRNTMTTEGLPNSSVHEGLPAMTVLFFFFNVKMLMHSIVFPLGIKTFLYSSTHFHIECEKIL